MFHGYRLLREHLHHSVLRSSANDERVENHLSMLSLS
jgi:hypothetical protein